MWTTSNKVNWVCFQRNKEKSIMNEDYSSNGKTPTSSIRASLLGVTAVCKSSSLPGRTKGI